MLGILGRALESGVDPLLQTAAASGVEGIMVGAGFPVDLLGLVRDGPGRKLEFDL